MIEQLTKQIFDDLNRVSSQFSSAREESSSLIKSVIESNLRKLNIVTREEFDAQQSVLEKTREKLEILEKKFEQLEQGSKPLNTKADS